MNTAYFIAKRIILNRNNDSLSRPIIRIAALGIAVGIAVMIIAIAVVTGFQKEIRNKVIGFGSHIQITGFSSNNLLNDDPINVNQSFYPWMDTIKGVKHIQQFALKQAILETPTDIEGILIKGLGENFNWDFFKDRIIEGEKLDPGTEELKYEALISSYQARRLNLSVGDKIAIYFADGGDDFKQRNFTVKGIFETGLEELDRQFVFIDIRIIRKINNWGIEAHMRIEGCENGKVVVEALGYGGRGVFRYEWNKNLEGAGPHAVCLNAGDTLRVKVYDKWKTIPDTAFIVAPHFEDQECFCPEEDNYQYFTSGGSGKYYTGGFEVILEKYEDLGTLDARIYEMVGYDLKTTTIHQQNPEIFNWLEMLDLNVIVLITLMIVVAIVNMTSALLILILERTNMIGILKAMGANNWTIRKIFLHQASFLIVGGMILGNVLGIGLGILQQETGIFKLDPTNYYVAQVPVDLNWVYILSVNFGTLFICLLVLILPTYVITRITPVKAIKFD